MFKNWLCFSGAQTTSEQVDFACMPLTMAFMLYNKGVDLKLINVSTWGIFYIVGQDTEITSIEDLKGKEIAVSDSAGLHSSTLRHILIQNNAS